MNCVWSNFLFSDWIVCDLCGYSKVRRQNVLFTQKFIRSFCNVSPSPLAQSRTAKRIRNQQLKSGGFRSHNIEWGRSVGGRRRVGEVLSPTSRNIAHYQLRDWGGHAAMQFYLCFGISVYGSTFLPLSIKWLHVFLFAHCQLYDQFGELNINL